MSPADRCWQRLPLAQRTGSEVFAALFQSGTSRPGIAGIATLLESPYPTVEAGAPARYSICAGPPHLRHDDPQLWTPAVGEILPLLRRLAAAAVPPPQSCPCPELPFIGGWLGWLGYDLAWEIERLPRLRPDPLPFPVAFWYEPAQFAVLDHQAQVLWLAAPSLAELAELKAKLARPLPLGESSEQVTDALTLATDRTAFIAAVGQAQDSIRAGDVFQVNLSLRFSTHTSASSWQVYRALQRINPSPFASYWHTPWGAVSSCSPERLVALRDRTAQTRPIAGTRPRGETATADQVLAQTLGRHPKEIAEHIMLVDLERNDLGRVCRWGSVQVDELMTIERYSHVIHLVSNIIGQLRPDQTAADLIAAMFPGGTITGCPKVRCMELIEALEPVRRSLFYGSAGYLDARGHLDLNILIRTLLMARVSQSGHQQGGHRVWGQVGAGIVADSLPEQEWLESLQKAKAQLLALGLS
nr:anthranilate synthase component I [Romeria gracilis]